MTINELMRRGLVAITCALVLGVAIYGCEKQPFVEYVVWHTETDPQASAFIESVADSVESELRADPDFEYDVNIQVTDLPWGGLVSRIQEEKANPPDLTHVQPFMVPQLLDTAFWDGKFRVYPLDSLVDEIGEDRIHPSILNLHRYPTASQQDSSVFGLAYAVGTTFVSYRRDWSTTRLSPPKTWRDLVTIADELAGNSGERNTAPFILPGEAPFFVAQLVNEMVVSMKGGSLYTEGGRPNFDTPQMREALWVLQEMVARTDGRFETTGYLEQFELLANGEGAVVPVTYGRATKSIASVLGQDSAATVADAFGVFAQPGGGLSADDTVGIATIDAEQWIRIGRADPESDDRFQAKRRVGYEFLKAFYNDENYLAFSELVPVHLRPIFSDLASEYDEKYQGEGEWSHWGHWEDQSGTMIDAGRTAPILMNPPRVTMSNEPTYLVDLETRHILSDLVRNAATDEIVRAISSSDASDRIDQLREDAIERAIKRAQARAMELYRQTAE